MAINGTSDKRLLEYYGVQDVLPFSELTWQEVIDDKSTHSSKKEYVEIVRKLGYHYFVLDDRVYKLLGGGMKYKDTGFVPRQIRGFIS